jgi:inosine-uridine nucleoside N-ribohydrolase
MKTKILFDTDIGSDIDDAVCLAYLLANPDCDLLGITTVTGEVVKRAAMASVLCKVAGRNIPIFPGTDQPLLVSQRQPTASQATALAKWPHEAEFPRGQALGFMRETIRRHPHEVTLLAVGPLTNVALLFAMDPEIPALLKGLVMMCGKFSGQTASHSPCEWCEWNAMLDPHATAIVFHHPVKVHRSIGIDVTLKVTMPASEVRQRFTAPLLRPVLDFAEVWFRHTDQVTFHDPLAATTIFDDGICGFEKGEVTVELASPQVAGMTHWDPGAQEPRHEVAMRVDPARFFSQYFGVFSKG